MNESEPDLEPSEPEPSEPEPSDPQPEQRRQSKRTRQPPVRYGLDIQLQRMLNM